MTPLATDPRTQNMEDVAEARPQDVGGTQVNIEYAVNQILTALNNKQYNWRTIDGLHRETGLSVSLILQLLQTNLADKVIRSSVRDNEGRSLFTLRERYRESRGLLGRLLSALSDQVR